METLYTRVGTKDESPLHKMKFLDILWETQRLAKNQHIQFFSSSPATKIKHHAPYVTSTSTVSVPTLFNTQCEVRERDN